MSYIDAEEYTMRLWRAEALLESLGWKRGADGKWRKKLTTADMKELAQIKALAGDKMWASQTPGERDAQLAR